jgi:hypothetical protein
LIPLGGGSRSVVYDEDQFSSVNATGAF